MSYALKLLGLGLGAPEIEVQVCYRQLAREYHPDKNNQDVTGLTTTEASDFYKLLNNANMFLQGQM
jgi:DnaJ-class molecular chaperone